MNNLYENRKAKKPILFIQFSKYGEILGLSCFDGKIYLHNAESYNLIQTVEIPGASIFIKAFDFSLDTKYIRIACNQDELYYFSTEKSEVFQSPTLLHDTVWNSYTVPFTFNTQGLIVSPSSF